MNTTVKYIVPSVGLVSSNGLFYFDLKRDVEKYFVWPPKGGSKYRFHAGIFAQCTPQNAWNSHAQLPYYAGCQIDLSRNNVIFYPMEIRPISRARLSEFCYFKPCKSILLRKISNSVQILADDRVTWKRDTKNFYLNKV